MDGDSSRRAMEKGANAQMTMDDHSVTGKPAQEPMGEKTTGTGTSAFDSAGAIGKQFTSGGAIGGTAEKVGGPFSSSGAIGSKFTDTGSLGGTVQNTLGKGEENTVNK